MSNLGKHQGSCHCGNIRYEVSLDLTKPAISCNCSICERTGALLAFVPATEFKLLAGADSITDYRFGKKRINHLFCKSCGVRPFATGAGHDGTEMRAINLRCLEGIDLGGLTLKQVDGRSL